MKLVVLMWCRMYIMSYGYLAQNSEIALGSNIVSMLKKSVGDKSTRKLTKLGKKSIGLTLPIELVRELGWRERQKVTVKRVRRGVLIQDWKK